MNEIYLNRMKEMLGNEFELYLESISCPPRRGMRINTLKSNEDEVFALTGLQKEKSPFAENGFYLHDEQGLGFTPAYLTGMYYIQEPSASAAVTCLGVEQGMNVLDMCAAPGSKSTQIAEKLQNTGFLCVNDINSKRAHILLENIERCGTANTLVLNTDTAKIADAFEGFFDRVLCDAPCSGEGMFRKNDEAETNWSISNVEACALRQAEIIDNAYRCLRPGGIMVYSTCTFAKEENEYLIRDFVKRHPDMHPEDPGVSFGRKAYDEGEDTDRAIRIFPMDQGEGHFICRLRKDGDDKGKVHCLKSDCMQAFTKRFLDENLSTAYPYYFVKNGLVYGGTAPFVDAGRCRILRHQVLLGEEKNNRFEPSHHFFMSSYGAVKKSIELSDEDLRKYFHGEELHHVAEKGFMSVCWHSHSVGGVKSDGKVLKNRYPKGLRF